MESISAAGNATVVQTGRCKVEDYAPLAWHPTDASLFIADGSSIHEWTESNKRSAGDVSEYQRSEWCFTGKGVVCKLA